MKQLQRILLLHDVRSQEEGKTLHFLSTFCLSLPAAFFLNVSYI